MAAIWKEYSHGHFSFRFWGTSIKYGLWKEELIEQGVMPLPKTWEEALKAIEKFWNVIETMGI